MQPQARVGYHHRLGERRGDVAQPHAPAVGRLQLTVSKLSRRAFLALILVQAAHSTEEYFGRLYDVLAPARFVSGLFFSDPRIGFVIFNASLVAVGVWSYFGPLRHSWPSATAISWAWVVLELLNGAAHITWALAAGAYRPGLITAPVLAVAALILASSLRRTDAATRART